MSKILLKEINKNNINPLNISINIKFYKNYLNIVKIVELNSLKIKIGNSILFYEIEMENEDKFSFN